MGKKKNKNKVSGAVKTAAKTEKKLANKLKKELADLGEVSSCFVILLQFKYNFILYTVQHLDFTLKRN